MIPFQSVKLRLTAAYAFILTIFLSFFAILMRAELARALYQDIDRNLMHEVKSLEESLVLPSNQMAQHFSMEPKGLLLPPALNAKLRDWVLKWELKNRRISHSTSMIRFVGLNHVILLSNLSGWEKEIIFPDFERDSVLMEKGESFQTIHFRNRPIRLYYRLFRYRSRPLFVIQAAASVQSVRNTLDRFRLIILVSIPGAVAMACLIGWFLVKRSLRPVDSMIQEARQITAAYLKGRLPRTHAGDELDRLAETLNEMMDRIEASTRSIQDFSSDISHELKTPLAIIRGEIDLALRKSRTPEVFMQTLRVIEGEVNELIRLVDDLILLVRSDAKQLHFEKKIVSLSALLQQVRERFQDRADAKGVQVSLNPHANVEIKGDAVYLKRLFSNLLDNAIKFTPEGGKVWMTLKQENRRAVVEVADTGMGIEPEMQAKVFSRFYRTDQARSQEGSGLGLNIAKTICEAHSGKIQIFSQLGSGTNVIVSLPL